LPEDIASDNGGLGGKRVSRPFGRLLVDFYLDGQSTPHALLPAEERLLTAMPKGQRLTLAEARPTKATTKNRVRAEFLRYLALGGDDEIPVHEKGVQLDGAYVEGEKHSGRNHDNYSREILCAGVAVSAQVTGSAKSLLLARHDAPSKPPEHMLIRQVRVRPTWSLSMSCDGSKTDPRNGSPLRQLVTQGGSAWITSPPTRSRCSSQRAAACTDLKGL
jgi:hypothetical protein